MSNSANLCDKLDGGQQPEDLLHSSLEHRDIAMCRHYQQRAAHRAALAAAWSKSSSSSSNSGRSTDSELLGTLQVSH